MIDTHQFVPAFPGVPGGPELLIILFLLLIAFVPGWWVYRDAKSRGSDYAWQWGVGVGVLFLLGLVPGLVALILYVVVRGDRSSESM